MQLSYVITMVWVFLMSTVQMGWWVIDARLLGFVGLAAVVVFVLEAVSIINWKLPGRRV